MSTADLPPALVERAGIIQRQCTRLASEFSVRAARKQRLQGSITAFSNLVGIVALVVAFYLPGMLVAGTDLVKATGVAAALVLIIVPYLQMAVYRDPPTRHQDYSFYIGGYAHKIDEIVADVKSVRRYERLMEVLALADKNLNDVRSKWPELTEKIDKELSASPSGAGNSARA
jgi:hypothetical protein